MKKLTTYFLSTGCIIAAAAAMGVMASADVTVSPAVDVVVEKGKDPVSTTTFKTLDDAVKALAGVEDPITITLDKEYTLTQKLPSKSSSITITAESATNLKVSGAVAAKGDLTLNNVVLTGSGAKAKLDVKGDLNLTAGAKITGIASIKGGKGENSVFTVSTDQTIDGDISGFGKIDVTGSSKLSLVGNKKIQTGEIAVATGAALYVYDTPIQVDTLSGAGTIYYVSFNTSDGKTTVKPAAITIKKQAETPPTLKLGYKAATAAKPDAPTATEITASTNDTTTAPTVFPDGTKVLTVAKAPETGAATGFSLATTAASETDATTQATTNYTFSVIKKKDVYVRPVAYGIYKGTAETPVTKALWSEVAEYIETQNTPDAAYTVKLLVDIDVEGAIKMPKKGTYKELTIQSGMGISKQKVAAKKMWSTSENIFFTKSGTTYVGSKTPTNTASAAEVKYYKVTLDSDDKPTALTEVSAIPATAAAKNTGSIYTAIKAYDEAITVVKKDDDTDLWYVEKPTGNTLTSYTYTVYPITVGDANTVATKGDTASTVTVTGNNVSDGFAKGGENTEVYMEKAALAQLSYTGGISATADLTLKDLTLYAYKASKNKDKSITKKGTDTAIAGSKSGTLTLDNVHLYQVTEDGKIKDKTTLKSLGASTLVLKNQDDSAKIVSAKVTGTKLVLDGETFIETSSLSFKGNKSAETADGKKGISAAAGTLNLTLVDSKTGAVLKDAKKAKATIEGFSNEGATLQVGTAYYVWGYNGKNVAPLGGAASVAGLAEKITYVQKADGASVACADLKSANAYILAEVKAGRAEATDNWTITLPAKPAKIELPKAGNYGTLTLTAGPDTFTSSAPLDLGTVKSLKLTGNLVLADDIAIKVTKLAKGSFTFTYTQEILANTAYVNAVNALVATKRDTSTAAPSYTDVETASANKRLNLASEDEIAGVTGTIKTAAAAKAALENYKAAVKFVTDNKTVLESITSAGKKESEVTGAKAAYEAFTALDAGVKSYLANIVKATGTGDDTTYQWTTAS